MAFSDILPAINTKGKWKLDMIHECRVTIGTMHIESSLKLAQEKSIPDVGSAEYIRLRD